MIVTTEIIASGRNKNQSRICSGLSSKSGNFAVIDGREKSEANALAG
jgi:hypothetical protein